VQLSGSLISDLIDRSLHCIASHRPSARKPVAAALST